jgi:Dolichyl-phosphate-mannose-protein mannosyltransferase
MSTAPPWDRTAWVIAALLGLAVLLNWPYLSGGFQADDLLLINRLREDPLAFSRWRGLWDTVDVPAFTSLWWADEGFDGAFWRPLPSLVFEGSIRLLGDIAWPLHLLSILLHGAVGAALYLLVRRLSRSGLLALLAAVLFVTCEDHSMGVGWISTVTDLICAHGVLLALLAQQRWLATRRALWIAGVVAALGLAFVSKESGVIAPLLVVLLALFMPTGHDGDDTSLRRTAHDVASWLPALLCLGIYLAAYARLDLGGMRNLMYLDPIAQPGAYLAHAVLHLPVLWAATITPLPPSLAMFAPQLLVALAVFGAACFVVTCALLWPHRRNALVRWAFIGWLVALLPQVATDASERALYLPFLMASVFLATLLSGLGRLAARMPQERRLAGRRHRIAAWLVLSSVLAPGVVMSAGMPFAMRASLSAPADHARTALPHVELREPEHILLLNTAGSFDTFYPAGVLTFDLRRSVDARPLSSCNAVMSVLRESNDAFILRADRAGWISNTFARIVRVKPALRRGKRYDNDLFSVELLELTPSGDDVLAARFTMKRPLDDPATLFLYWNGSAFAPLDLAALGEPKQLADTSDIWASME